MIPKTEKILKFLGITSFFSKKTAESRKCLRNQSPLRTSNGKTMRLIKIWITDIQFEQLTNGAHDSQAQAGGALLLLALIEALENLLPI